MKHLPAVQRVPEAAAALTPPTKAKVDPAGPVPLILCCNKPPPGCGFCWYCLQALYHEINILALKVSECFEEMSWPRILIKRDPFAAGWKQWGGPKK